jgi:DNA-binding transcriptional LysR family regulator
MELRQLEYFVAVAEERSFTRAAERVHISQSGVSAQVRQLERDLGAPLFDRSGRTATLTAAGEAALAHARETLSAAGAVRGAVDDVNRVVRGRLVVGMVTACTVTPLFDALARFHTAHPGVELELVEDTSDRLVDGVRTGGLDLGLVGVAGAPPADLPSLTLISEGLAALVPPGHPLAGGDDDRDGGGGDRRAARAPLAAVAEHPIVSLPAGTGIRTAFDRSCAARGLRPRIALQATAPDAVADLAARGLGVGILSASMAADPAADVRAIAIDDVEIPALLALVWPPTPSPALRALLDIAREAFAGADPRP